LYLNLQNVFFIQDYRSHENQADLEENDLSLQNINTQISADNLDYGFRNTEEKNKIVILLYIIELFVKSEINKSVKIFDNDMFGNFIRECAGMLFCLYRLLDIK